MRPNKPLLTAMCKYLPSTVCKIIAYLQIMKSGSVFSFSFQALHKFCCLFVESQACEVYIFWKENSPAHCSFPLWKNVYMTVLMESSNKCMWCILKYFLFQNVRQFQNNSIHVKICMIDRGVSIACRHFSYMIITTFAKRRLNYT